MAEETKVTATGVHGGGVGTAGHPAPAPLKKGAVFNQYGGVPKAGAAPQGSNQPAKPTLPAQPTMAQLSEKIDSLTAKLDATHADSIAHQTRVEKLLAELKK